MKVESLRKNGSIRGSFVLEAALAWTVLLVIAIVMFKAYINVVSAQRWTVMQSMTDAYLTQEVALATRIPYNNLKQSESLWPTFPGISTSTVEIGRLPGGKTISASLARTKRPDQNNLPSAGGIGTDSSNPAGMEAWRLHSYLTYSIGNRDYIKARTMLRVR